MIFILPAAMIAISCVIWAVLIREITRPNLDYRYLALLETAMIFVGGTLMVIIAGCLFAIVATLFYPGAAP